jgi:hypothetical protein
MSSASSIVQTIGPFKQNGQICFEPVNGESVIGESKAHDRSNGAHLA